MDANGAAAFFLIDIPIAIGKLLDIAVEIDTDEFCISVDDG